MGRRPRALEDLLWRSPQYFGTFDALKGDYGNGTFYPGIPLTIRTRL